MLKSIVLAIAAVLATIAAMQTNFLSISSNLDRTIDSVCGDYDIFSEKPRWPCSITKRWDKYLRKDEVESRKELFSGGRFLDFGVQCFDNDIGGKNCRPDSTDNKDQRCVALDPQRDGSPKFCLSRDGNCPFPGTGGLSAGADAPTGTWSGKEYKCVADTDGTTTQQYRVERIPDNN